MPTSDSRYLLLLHVALPTCDSRYLLLLETDHVIMKPIPNLATADTPAAFTFGYMFAHPSQDAIIRKYWPEGSSAALDPVGPSPLLIHVEQLAKVHARWLRSGLGSGLGLGLG